MPLKLPWKVPKQKSVLLKKSQALNFGRKVLASVEFPPVYAAPEPGLEAALILAHITKQSRENLYMSLQDNLSPKDFQEYKLQLQRRINGEPLAWIIGIKEFWGLDFTVGPGILCPRPESEHLVETAIKWGKTLAQNQPIRLHDCCTGSGNLAISLALQNPDWEISASDNSDIARKFFEINNDKLAGGRIRFRQSSLLENLDGPYEIIISNPPYLSPRECHERISGGWLEPVQALNGGGKNGLDIICRLITQAKEKISSGGTLIIEAAPNQMPVIQQFMQKRGFGRCQIHTDLSGKERVIQAFRQANES